ncbi:MULTISPECIES: hypothetical protein [Methanobacterium]|uniref:Uncharacterized protein n=1 Tax=Methanobacterium bryantii TaxID=2161 RepID=A0A2A2H8G7_METBR|nr:MULTISPECIES: hypothetical protein [Methanobacterium]OEC84741.1 hypothetical protein A9507_14835 [Methanobacterium sp. A39]PAV05560.1 hypothetical protein ASJ80_08580 [Methanobacterium bryantii]
MSEKPVDEKRQKWITRLSILVAIWGILSLEFSSTVFGVIFILFAVLIYLSKSFMVIYMLGAILWILGAIQLLNAAGFNTGFTVSAAYGIELVIVAVANFVIGGLIIYRTKKLE